MNLYPKSVAEIEQKKAMEGARGGHGMAGVWDGRNGGQVPVGPYGTDTVPAVTQAGPVALDSQPGEQEYVLTPEMVEALGGAEALEMLRLQLQEGEGGMACGGKLPKMQYGGARDVGVSQEEGEDRVARMIARMGKKKEPVGAEPAAPAPTLIPEASRESVSPGAAGVIKTWRSWFGGKQEGGSLDDTTRLARLYPNFRARPPMSGGNLVVPLSVPEMVPDSRGRFQDNPALATLYKTDRAEAGIEPQAVPLGALALNTMRAAGPTTNTDPTAFSSENVGRHRAEAQQFGRSEAAVQAPETFRRQLAGITAEGNRAAAQQYFSMSPSERGRMPDYLADYLGEKRAPPISRNVAGTNSQWRRELDARNAARSSRQAIESIGSIRGNKNRRAALAAYTKQRGQNIEAQRDVLAARQRAAEFGANQQRLMGTDQARLMEAAMQREGAQNVAQLEAVEAQRDRQAAAQPEYEFSNKYDPATEQMVREGSVTGFSPDISGTLPLPAAQLSETLQEELAAYQNVPEESKAEAAQRLLRRARAESPEAVRAVRQALGMRG